MNSSIPQRHIRPAKLSDIESIAHLMADYYREDGYWFQPDLARENLNLFLSNHQLGGILVAGTTDQVTGYIIVTFGFSFEYGGRDAFIDELFVAQDFRGHNLGRELLDSAIVFCRENDVKVLHLEVEREKEMARQFYARTGFTDHDRFLMTLDLR